MQQLKIREDLWKLILEGKKKFEFRKLEKGLITGTYEFVSIEKYCMHCGKAMSELPDSEISIYQDYYHRVHSEPLKNVWFKPKIFGTAKLTPFIINPTLVRTIPFQKEAYYLISGLGSREIDKETYDFVKQNYSDKDLDFVGYKIGEVKDHGN